MLSTFLITLMNIYCEGSIGDLPIKLRALSTPQEWAQGYQFHLIPPVPGEGLLFIFNEEAPRTFHMKNVDFDLDLLAFDSSGKLLSKIPMKGNAEISYKTPACKFIVEAPCGWSSCLKPGGCLLRVRKVQ